MGSIRLLINPQRHDAGPAAQPILMLNLRSGGLLMLNWASSPPHGTNKTHTSSISRKRSHRASDELMRATPRCRRLRCAFRRCVRAGL